MRVDFILACHNRRDLSVRAVASAIDACRGAGVTAAFTVFDDGSSDGTATALAQLPAEITILRGDGSAYWAKSMAAAESLALRLANGGELLIWLNDDVVLDPDAIARMSEVLASHPQAVVVGAMREPGRLTTSYSGMKRRGLHPLSFELVEPEAECTAVDTFNGNFVVMTMETARRLGGIDGGFSHALADIDYGLRCARARVPVLLAPGSFGECARNSPVPASRTREDWRRFVGVKGGGHPGSLRRIMRRHHRSWWVVPVLATYTLWWVRRMRTAAFGGGRWRTSGHFSS